MTLPKVLDQILLKLLVCFSISDIMMSLNEIRKLTCMVALFRWCSAYKLANPLVVDVNIFIFISLILNYHIVHYNASCQRFL